MAMNHPEVATYREKNDHLIFLLTKTIKILNKMGEILNLVGVGHHSYVDVGVPSNLQHYAKIRGNKNHCCGSGSTWIRIHLAVLDLDPDPY
jgi:hypothetical protein